MSNPTFSVCIPTYNRAGMLPRAIDSVLQQSFRDFELLVLDNASTDGTAELLGRYNDPRLRVIRNASTVSMFENHNLCIEPARANWIVYVHSDDACVPTALEAFANAIAQKPDRLGIIYAGLDRPGLRTLEGRSWFINRLGLPYSLALCFNGVGPPSVACFRREALQQVGGFPTDPSFAYHGDHDIAARIADAGWEFHLLDVPVELKGLGKHQATWDMEHTVFAQQSIAATIRSWASLGNWRSFMDLLAEDIGNWPAGRASQGLYLLASAGLREEYRRVRRACRRRGEMLHSRVGLTASFVATVGPRTYFMLSRTWKRLRFWWSH